MTAQRTPVVAIERRFDTSDGYHLRYRVWPAVGKRVATVVLLNGIMSHSTWFSPLAPLLCEEGLQLVGADRRGSGDNKVGWGDAPSAAALVEDVLAIIDIEQEGTPLFILGWCWGAALAVNVAVKLKERLSGLILVTPGMFPTPQVADAMKAQSQKMTEAAPDRPCIDSPIREEMFTAGPALRDFIGRDPHRLKVMTPRLAQVSGKLAISASARLRQLSTPGLVLLADDDDATDNAATEAAFARLPADQFSLHTLSSKHGVQFDDPSGVHKIVTHFIRRLTGG